MLFLFVEYFVLMYNLKHSQPSSTPLIEISSPKTSQSSPHVVTESSGAPESPGQQRDLPLPVTSTSAPHVFTLQESQGQQSDHPLPGNSSGVFILPESPEQLHELGITEGITELSPFNEAHKSGNGDLKGLYLIMTLIKKIKCNKCRYNYIS